MSFHVREFLVVSAVLICCLYAAGCVSTTIGDVTYSDAGLAVSFTHDGGPSEGYVQVTVYQVKNNLQEEKETLYAPFNLQPGRNTAYINGTLEPGQYKLRIYLIQDGERKTAAIRDIVVS